MTCEFCDATEALEVCDWPVKKFIKDTYSTLKVGDSVQRANEKRIGRVPATVTELRPVPAGIYVELLLGKV